jgi:hypothetical protein
MKVDNKKLAGAMPGLKEWQERKANAWASAKPFVETAIKDWASAETDSDKRRIAVAFMNEFPEFQGLLTPFVEGGVAGITTLKGIISAELDEMTATIHNLVSLPYQDPQNQDHDRMRDALR